MTPRDIHDKALALKAEYERSLRELRAQAETAYLEIERWNDKVEADHGDDSPEFDRSSEIHGLAEDTCCVLDVEIESLTRDVNNRFYKRVGTPNSSFTKRLAANEADMDTAPWKEGN